MIHISIIPNKNEYEDKFIIIIGGFNLGKIIITSSSNFTFILPEPITNVISMKIIAIEIPNF